MQRLQQAEASASATMMLPRTTVPPRERVEAGGRLSTAPTAAMAAGARQPCGGRGDLRRAFSFTVNTKNRDPRSPRETDVMLTSHRRHRESQG